MDTRAAKRARVGVVSPPAPGGVAASRGGSRGGVGSSRGNRGGGAPRVPGGAVGRGTPSARGGGARRVVAVRGGGATPSARGGLNGAGVGRGGANRGTHTIYRRRKRAVVVSQCPIADEASAQRRADGGCRGG